MKLAAWNANNWVACNGCISMQTHYPALPGEVSESRREGIAIHELVQRELEFMKYQPDDYPHHDRSKSVGSTSSNGVLITSDMVDAAGGAVDDVLKVVKLGGCRLEVEEPVDCSFIHPDLKQIKPDCYVWNANTTTLDVWDFKFGHRIVEAFENYQLILYVFGILPYVNYDATIRMHIFQPFVSHSEGISRVWECKLFELRDKYINPLFENAKRAADGTGVCTPGSACNDCSGRRGCESLQRSIYSALDYHDCATPAELKGVGLASEYNLLTHHIDLLKSRLTGIEEQVMYDISQGEVVPGLSVTIGKGRKGWRKDIDKEEIAIMGDRMGVDLRKPLDLETPTKCIKLGVDESVINAYSETPNGKMKIVKNDDYKIRKMFK